MKECTSSLKMLLTPQLVLVHADKTYMLFDVPKLAVIILLKTHRHIQRCVSPHSNT